MHFDSVRLLLCRAWGIPPWELDGAIADNRVSLRDAMRAVICEMVMTPGADVAVAIDIAELERRRERAATIQQVKALAMKLQALKKGNPNLDDPESLAIKATLARLNQPPAGK